MPRGSTVYRSLSDRVSGLEAELAELNRGLEAAEGQLAEAHRARAGTYRALAEKHLPELTARGVARTMEALRDRIGGILDEKRAEREVCRALLLESAEREDALRTRLDELTGRLNEVGRERERLEDEVRETLAARDGYAELAERRARLRERVSQMERRHRTAEAERREKVPVYERNPLFSYLLRREYGTPRARGGALTRGLDDRVAAVVGFDEAIESYRFLNDLPEHVGALLRAEREKLDALEAKVGTIEREAADRAGLTAVNERGDRLYEEREGLIERIAAADRDRTHFTGRLDELEDTRGEFYEKALGELQAHLGARPIAELEAGARETEDPEDDELVEKVDILTATIVEQDRRIDELQAKRRTLEARLAGLREIRDDFVRKDYDGRRSEFDGGFDIDDLVHGFLVGRLTAGHVSRQIDSHHRFRAAPSPAPSRGRFGRASGFSSGGGFGGFSGGGGFGGGGGFSTGGGF